ncbi:MAG: SDR family NAD(P)-dependent oxidoreductase [Actinobacteria bacterium]|nr:SDR family NAD(P)-dependent oxidoreductase [Actinomycetota bacterium]
MTENFRGLPLQHIPHGWNAADLPDLSGKRFLITGGTSGIGKEAARELARAGASVTISARSRDKGEKVRKEISIERVDVLELDLADLESVRKAAREVKDDIDVLILNAGVMAVPFTRTADGFELQIGGWGIHAFAAHPGYSNTNLQSVGPKAKGSVVEERATALMNAVIAQSAAKGALPTLCAATFPDLYGASYIGPSGFMEMRGYPKAVRARSIAYDQVLAQNLWSVSEELTGVQWR